MAKSQDGRLTRLTGTLGLHMSTIESPGFILNPTIDKSLSPCRMRLPWFDYPVETGAHNRFEAFWVPYTRPQDR